MQLEISQKEITDSLVEHVSKLTLENAILRLSVEKLSEVVEGYEKHFAPTEVAHIPPSTPVHPDLSGARMAWSGA